MCHAFGQGGEHVDRIAAEDAAVSLLLRTGRGDGRLLDEEIAAQHRDPLTLSH
jgi:hypothetical protein